MNWFRSRLVGFFYFLVAAPVLVLVLSALPQHAAPQPPGDTQTRALGINNFGVIVGEAGDSGFRLSSELNVQFTTDARYQDFLAGATERQVLGLAVPVASLQEIVRGKVWAWQDKERRSTKRKKDKLGLMRIAEAHPKLRGLIPAEIVKQL